MYGWIVLLIPLHLVTVCDSFIRDCAHSGFRSQQFRDYKPCYGVCKLPEDVANSCNDFGRTMDITAPTRTCRASACLKSDKIVASIHFHTCKYAGEKAVCSPTQTFPQKCSINECNPRGRLQGTCRVSCPSQHCQNECERFGYIFVGEIGHCFHPDGEQIHHYAECTISGFERWINNKGRTNIYSTLTSFYLPKNTNHEFTFLYDFYDHRFIIDVVEDSQQKLYRLSIKKNKKIFDEWMGEISKLEHDRSDEAKKKIAKSVYVERKWKRIQNYDAVFTFHKLNNLLYIHWLPASNFLNVEPFGNYVSGKLLLDTILNLAKNEWNVDVIELQDGADVLCFDPNDHKDTQYGTWRDVRFRLLRSLKHVQETNYANTATNYYPSWYQKWGFVFKDEAEERKQQSAIETLTTTTLQNVRESTDVNGDNIVSLIQQGGIIWDSDEHRNQKLNQILYQLYQNKKCGIYLQIISVLRDVTNPNNHQFKESIKEFESPPTLVIMRNNIYIIPQSEIGSAYIGYIQNRYNDISVYYNYDHNMMLSAPNNFNSDRALIDGYYGYYGDYGNNLFMVNILLFFILFLIICLLFVVVNSMICSVFGTSFRDNIDKANESSNEHAL